MELNPYFHLSFRPNIKLVSTVRRFTAEFYQRVLVDQELSQRLALATHELLENAVAYAIDGETGIRIEIEGDKLRVSTWNRTTTERVEGVKALINEINAAPDPQKFYQELVVKSSRRTDDGSGLGLARIKAEAEMSVAYEIDHRNNVCIVCEAIIAGGLKP